MKKIKNRIDQLKEEERMLAFWQKEKIFGQLRKRLAGGKKWSFIDGPITANNPLGVHHGWGRSYKDLFQRYYARKGFDQRFQNGFDGQGLWVEVGVEKELGLNSKRDIEKYGLAKFARKCRGRVEKFSRIIIDQSKRLGQWMDWENSYQTLSDNNIEHIWHFLKVSHQKKMLYQGSAVLPWCPRCGTSLSSHELYDSYRLVKHRAVYLKYPLKGEQGTSLLVWTTTPWTLVANVAVAVDPELDYVKVKAKNEELILAKDRLGVIKGKYQVVSSFKGKDLIGREYQGAFDDLPAVEASRGHPIIGWDEVGADEGSGLVHIAPGCGQEDFQLAKENKLAVISPIDEAGFYLKGFGSYSGKSSSKINEKIFDDLRGKGLLYRTEEYRHRYPLCWRCGEELVFRSVKEWFIKTDPVREKMKEEARKVRWVPKEGGRRMENWLENMADWNISRKRYWGLPLPIYVCPYCGEVTVIGSKEELKKRAIDPQEVDRLPELHRPWVDKVKIRCPKCMKPVERVPEVGDCWLDAGIVPFSTLDYLSDKKYWRKWFPAKFIVEMKEQIRLWFYSMLLISVVLEGRTPYREVLTHSEVTDEKGEEMHKSKGNAIWLNEALEKVGADVIRWLYLNQNPAYSLRFGFQRAEEIKSKFNTWWNSLYFLVSYADIDGWEPRDKERAPNLGPRTNILDRWILIRLNQLNYRVEKAMANLRPDLGLKDFDAFLDDLSNWYIRRSRRRFWKSVDDSDKKSAYATLYQVLISSAGIMAPYFPFFTESVYQVLRTPQMPESVHLGRFSRAKKLTADQNLLIVQMTQAREVINKALSIRAKKGIRVRQPLARLTLGISFAKEHQSQLFELIKEEVNVKEVESGPRFKLETRLTAQLREEGWAREIIRQIQSLRKKADYQLTDRIKVFFQTDSTKLKKAITNFSNYIKKEVLAEGELIGKKMAVDRETESLIGNNKVWLGVKRR